MNTINFKFSDGFENGEHIIVLESKILWRNT